MVPASTSILLPSWFDFLNKQLGENHPIITAGNLNDYRQIAIALSKHANCHLFWTMLGSPLSFDPAEGAPNSDESDSSDFHLTPEDIEYREIDCKKFRLIVFQNKKELKQFQTESVKPRGERIPRLTAFIKASTQGKGESTLMFTTVAHLESKFLSSDSKLDVGIVTMGDEKAPIKYYFRSPFAVNRSNESESKVIVVGKLDALRNNSDEVIVQATKGINFISNLSTKLAALEEACKWCKQDVRSLHISAREYFFMPVFFIIRMPPLLKKVLFRLYLWTQAHPVKM